MKLLGICACLFNFCWSVIIFSQGANDESLHFHFKSAEQVGNFASYSIRPLCVDMFQKCKFCFITEEGKDYKSRFSQSTARTSWFLKQKGVCLMNLFLESSDKLIIFLDSTLNSWNSRINSQDSRIDSQTFQTRESILETHELILKRFKNQDASDRQLTFEWYSTMEELGFSYVLTGMLLNTP